MDVADAASRMMAVASSTAVAATSTTQSTGTITTAVIGGMGSTPLLSLSSPTTLLLILANQMLAGTGASVQEGDLSKDVSQGKAATSTPMDTSGSEKSVGEAADGNAKVLKEKIVPPGGRSESIYLRQVRCRRQTISLQVLLRIL